MRLVPVVALAFACTSCGPPSTARAPIPWLSGFAPADSSEVESAEVQERIAAITGSDDAAGYGGLEVHARLGSDGASSTVLASVHQGLVVLDERGRVVARAPGVAPEDSADDLVALAAGDGQLASDVIALARTTGGHRTSTTDLALYALGSEGELERLFDQPVEEHLGDHTRTGSVTLIPRALIYCAPGGGSSWWLYDAETHRYQRRGALEPESRPGREGPARPPV